MGVDGKDFYDYYSIHENKELLNKYLKANDYEEVR